MTCCLGGGAPVESLGLSLSTAGRMPWPSCCSPWPPIVMTVTPWAPVSPAPWGLPGGPTLASASSLEVALL